MNAASSDSIGYRKSNVLFFHRKFFIKNANLLNAKTKTFQSIVWEKVCEEQQNQRLVAFRASETSVI